MKPMRYLLFTLYVLTVAMHAEPARMIVQLGQIDGDYKEFAIAGEFGAYMPRFGAGVGYTQALDDVNRNWPYIHPGPADAWAGSREHTHRIAFHLQRPLPQYARLTLALVSTHASIPPFMKISVNGQSGHIQLPHGTGDEALIRAAAGRPYRLVSVISGAVLRSGWNELAITLTAGSWVLYDAITLEALDEQDCNGQTVSRDNPPVQRIEVKQTPFFIRKQGRLRQLMTLRLQTPIALQTLPLTLSVAGRSRPLRMTTGLTGHAEAAFDVDPIDAPGDMVVQATISDKTYTAHCPVSVSRRWTIYLLASAHVDVGYTDWQPRVMDQHNQNTKLAIDLAGRYPEFIWNTEVGWVAENALEAFPAQDAQKLMDLAHQGRIGVPALYGNMLTGLCSHEELIRVLSLSYDIAKSISAPFDFAMSTDVPSHVAALPSVLAGCGVRYFAAGLNLYRAGGFNKLFNRSPFYWQGPDGAKVLTWLAPGYAFASGLGLDGSMDLAIEAVQQFLAGYDRPDYPFDAVLAFGAYSDNQALRESLPKTVEAWNRRYAYPRIVFCRGPEFFQYIESKDNGRIPVISGCGGVYWEDGAASTAHEIALVRRAKEILLAAEREYARRWWSGTEDWPARRLRDAWKNIVLFDEHTWGAAGSVTEPHSEQTRKQWAYKRLFAVRAYQQAQALLNDVSRDVQKQSVQSSDSELHPMSVPVDKPVTVEGTHYRLTWDPAIPAVTSLYDIELHRELLDVSAPWPMNAYVRAEGQGTSLHLRDPKVMSVRGWMVRTSSAMELKVEILYESGERMESTYRLPHLQKRLEIANRIDKPAVLSKEAGYFSFPVGLDAPQFHLSLPNASLNPQTGMLDGGCTDWFAVQDYVAVHNDDLCIVWTPIDSPLVTLNGLHREGQQADISGLAPVDPAMRFRNGHLYAYVFNNYWDTNYRAEQGGRIMFRFVITSRPRFHLDEVTALGRSAMASYFGIDTLGEQDDRSQQPALIAVQPESVMLQAFKRADHRDALILRLRETSGKPIQSEVHLPDNHGDVWLCDLLERPLERIQARDRRVRIELPAFGMVTIAVDRANR